MSVEISSSKLLLQAKELLRAVLELSDALLVKCIYIYMYDLIGADE